MLPIKFQVNWPFSSGGEAKNRFSRWQPSLISNWKDLGFFFIYIPLMLPIKFQVNWPFDSGDEGKIDF